MPVPLFLTLARLTQFLHREGFEALVDDPDVFRRESDGQMYFPHPWDGIVYQRDFLKIVEREQWHDWEGLVERFREFVAEDEEFEYLPYGE